jgi:hypothetical protein
MIITDTDIPLGFDDILQMEESLGIRLPDVVRGHYLKWNGGRPDPYVFEVPPEAVVSEILPLLSPHCEYAASEYYKVAVLEEQLVPLSFFPFAVDGGVNLFFVDCSTPEAKVFFYDYDASPERDAVIDLHISFTEFWNALR